jgi:replicative DNA helicase
VPEVPEVSMADIRSIKDGIAKGEIDPVKGAEQAIEQIQKKSVYRPPTREEKQKAYQRDKERKLRALQNSVYFIDPHFSTKFKLVQGLYLVGAISGQGKSTALRNILAGFVMQTSNKKARVLTNEESSMTVYDGVACVLLGFDFSKHQNYKNSPKEREKIEETAHDLMDKIDVEAGDSNFDMSCMEDVERVLRFGEEQNDAGLICLDYWQTVNHSRDNEEWESFRVLKELGFFLKGYGQRASCPVLNFVQLQGKADSKDFKSRIENDKTIYNHAFGAIEIIPDFENRTSKFVVVKDRHGGATGEVVEMAFSNGKYEVAGI